MRVDPDADTLVMTLPELRMPRPAVLPSAPAAAARPVHSKPSDPQTLDWPVPRRPWRRIICWFAGWGHFWFPGSDRCLECGRQRQRWAG